MYRYWAFGLSIASDIRLDELASDAQGDGTPDLTIRVEDLDRKPPEVDEAAIQFDYADPLGVAMIYPGVATFRIASPELIQVQPHPEVPDNYLPFPLLGPVMGWVLHLRKLFVLHASAVSLSGKSFTFMGDKLAGKSTTAAAFVRAGAELLTDDLLAIDTPANDLPMIRPAFAQLKLSEEAGASIKIPGANALPPIMEGFPKKQLRLPPVPKNPVPCDAIFLLQRGSDTPRIEWMDGASALTNLRRYSYVIRFSLAPTQMQERQRYFQQCALVSRRSRVGRLHVPADLDRLGEVVELVSQSVEAKAV